MWSNYLRTEYQNDFEKFELYASTYNLVGRLGYSTAEEAWADNPIVVGSDDPEDYMVLRDGIPCTVGIGSDRYAGKVAKVLSPKRIEVNGPGGGFWSLRDDGRWRPKGSGKRTGFFLILGVAEDYRDPSF